MKKMNGLVAMKPIYWLQRTIWFVTKKNLISLNLSVKVYHLKVLTVKNILIRPNLLKMDILKLE